LNTNHFIIEEFIPGEEYAIDYYHDQDGKVVILNILHHLFSSGSDTSDRVYTTSKNIITQHKSKIEDFLTIIGEELNLKTSLLMPKSELTSMEQFVLLKSIH
jgi:carbamoylphosphate synthase large subunit